MVSGHSATLDLFARPSPPRDLIDQLVPLLADLGENAPDTVAAIDLARDRARELLASPHANGEAANLTALAFVADVLASLVLTGSLSRDQIADLVERVAEVTALPADFVASAVCLRTLRDPRVLELPPGPAIEAQLRRLFLVGPVTEVSLWAKGPDGQFGCSLYFGEGKPTRRARAEARRILRGGAGACAERGPLCGVAVVRWQRPHAALLVRPLPGGERRALSLAHEAAGMLGPILEKETLLERSASREKSLVESSERRLTRLGFDLHDGAIQDIAALASDVRLFREQLAGVLPDGQHQDILLGRVDDLEARLVNLDGDLRGLARSFESPTSFKRPLQDVLRRELGTFTARTEIEAALEVEGDFTHLTTSQKIALLRIVQEALANAREHSGANEVRVSVVSGLGHVRAEIVDDGRGFDVESTLLRAARSGRLGLVGMGERVRLLGGTFDVQSRPGGPTSITVTLPEWRPLASVELLEEVQSEREPA